MTVKGKPAAAAAAAAAAADEWSSSQQQLVSQLVCIEVYTQLAATNSSDQLHKQSVRRLYQQVTKPAAAVLPSPLRPPLRLAALQLTTQVEGHLHMDC
jgi:hypothetical protein